MSTIAATVKWASNIAEYVNQTRSGIDSINLMTSAADRMATKLGTGVFNAARDAEMAITAMGGAENLTERQAESMSKKIDEAIQKFQALGQAVPTSLSHLSTELAEVGEKAKATGETFGPLTESFGKFAAAFSLANLFDRAVEGAIEFGKRAFETAHEIEVLAQKTGVSTDAIQRYKYVADLTGSTVEDFTGALFKMEAQLGSNAKKAQDAARDLGIPWAELKAQKPEEQLELIIGKLADMTDADRKAAYEIGIFGKAAGNSIAKLVDDYADLKDSAVIAAEFQIKAMAGMARAGKEFADQFETTVMAELGSWITIMAYAADHPVDFAKLVVGNPVLTLTGSLQPLAMAIDQINKAKTALSDLQKMGIESAVGFGFSVSQIATSMKLPVAAVKEYIATLKTQAPAAVDFIKDLANSRQALLDLTPAVKAQIDAGLALHLSDTKIAEGLNVSEEAVRLYQEQMKLATEVQKKAGEPLANYLLKLTELDDKIHNAMAAGVDYTQIVRDLGAEANKAATQSSQFGITLDKLPFYVGALNRAFDNFTVRDIMARADADMRAGLEKLLKTWIAEGDKMSAAELSSIQKALSAAAGIGDLYVKTFSTTIGEQLVAAENWKTKALESIQGLAKAYPSAFEVAKGEIDGIYADLTQRAVGFNAMTRDQLQAQAKDFQTAYNAMAASGLYTSAELAAAAERVRKAWIDAGSATAYFSESLRNTLKSIGPTLAAAVQNGDWRGAAEKISGEIGSDIGGAIGFSIGGPLGAAIGSAIGSLASVVAGWFSTPVWQQMQQTVGTEWGITISDALAKQLEADAKMLGGTEAAKVFNLKSLIDAGGGLDASNLTFLTGKLHDVFSAIEQGMFTSAQAAKVLDDNWASFVKTGSDGVGLLAPALVQIEQLNEQFGTGSKAIADYQAAQVTAASTGIAASLKITGDAYTKLAADQQKLADTLTSLVPEQPVDPATIKQIFDLQKDMALQQQLIDATGVHSQAAAAGISGALVGIVDANLKAGQSFITAVRGVAPAVAAFQQQLDATGYSGGAAFDFISQEVKLANDAIAGPAITAVEGYTSAIVGLSNVGMLTQETFGGLASQITGTFNSLIGQGKDAHAVLVAMAPDLQVLWEEQNKFGLKVDDGTQALIDQAKAAGLVGETHKSSTEQMVDALNHMSDVLDKIAVKWGAIGGPAGPLNGLAQPMPGVAEGSGTRFLDVQPQSGQVAGGGAAAATPTTTTVTIAPEIHFDVKDAQEARDMLRDPSFQRELTDLLYDNPNNVTVNIAGAIAPKLPA